MPAVVNDDIEVAAGLFEDLLQKSSVGLIARVNCGPAGLMSPFLDALRVEFNIIKIDVRKVVEPRVIRFSWAIPL